MPPRMPTTLLLPAREAVRGAPSRGKPAWVFTGGITAVCIFFMSVLFLGRRGDTSNILHSAYRWKRPRNAAVGYLILRPLLGLAVLLRFFHEFGQPGPVPLVENH